MNQLRMLGTDFNGFETYKIMSSAYRDNLCVKPPHSMPRKSLDCMRAMARGLMAIVKSKGDKLQPCRVPLPREKYSDCRPLVISEARG